MEWWQLALAFMVGVVFNYVLGTYLMYRRERNQKLNEQAIKLVKLESRVDRLSNEVATIVIKIHS